MKDRRWTASAVSLFLVSAFLLLTGCEAGENAAGSSPSASDEAAPAVSQWPEALDYPYGDEEPTLDLYGMDWNLDGNIYAHDPVIIREKGTWYVFCTGEGIQVRTSEDGRIWTDAGWVFTGYPSWVRDYVPGGVDSLWAPDIIKFGGWYYLYYSASSFGENTSVIGLARTKTLDPDSDDYGWEDLGPVIASSETDDYNCIDPNVAVDENGWPWLSFGSFWSGIKLVRLNPETMLPLEGEPLQSIADRGDATDAVEAPFIAYHNGFYYLFVSFDFCCQGTDSTYNIRVGRAESIQGPYTDQDGVSLMEGGGTLIDSSDSAFKGPGHCAVYFSGDTAILVNHAYSVVRGGSAVLRIKPLYFDADGWPTLEDPSAAPAAD